MKLEAFLKYGFFNQRFRVRDETASCLFTCTKGLYGALSVDYVSDDIVNVNDYFDHEIIGFSSDVDYVIVVCIRSKELNNE